MAQDNREPIAAEALSQPQHGGLVEAIEQAIAWHEEQDKAISKWPDANTGDNGWRRIEHQEQRNKLRAALASNSPVAEDEDDPFPCNCPNEGCEGHHPLCIKNHPIPTDTADHDVLRSKIKDAINAHVSECLRLGGALHPGPTADAILALIAAPDGMDEAREAWSKVLAGMKRFGMESTAIETIDDYFSSIPARDRWQHVAYFDEGEFHWMSGIAPRDCELYAMIAAATGEA